MQKLKNRLLDFRQDIQQKNIGLIDIKNKRDMYITRLNDYSENSNELNKDISRYSLEIKKLNKFIIQLHSSIDQCNKTLKKFYINEKNLNKQKNTFEINYSRNYQKFQSIQADISEKRNVKDADTEEINKIKLDIERMKGEKEFYQKQIDDIHRNLINKQSIKP